jgi:hypothetical protein
MNMMHETMLSDFIGDICATGVGRVEKRVLLRWFGQQKMSAGIWKALQQRFEAAITDWGAPVEDWRLLAMDSDDGHVSFACVDLGEIAKGEGWWEPVDVRAQAKETRRANKHATKQMEPGIEAEAP